MPGGLVNTLTRAEMIDLVAFLSKLGKLGPYSVGQAAFAHSWRTAEASSEAVAAARSTAIESILRSGSDGSLKWSPVYARVSGELPLDEIPAIEGSRVARTSIEVTTPGKVRLALSVPARSRLWIDSKSIDVQPEIDQTFEPGIHTLSFMFPADSTGPNPRVELREIEGSKAKATVVLGK